MTATTSLATFGGLGATDDSTAFTAIDAASRRAKPQPGLYHIANSITLSADWDFEGVILSISSTKTVTFNGNVSAPPTWAVFTGAGNVVLAGQRSPVYAEWWGAKADQSVDCSPAIKAMHDACVNGALWQPMRGEYLLASGVTFTNCISIRGAGRGYNPTVGGTVFRPSSTFAHSGGILFTMARGSMTWEGFMILGATTDPTQNYTAIRVVDGAGKLTLRDIELFGVGVGLNLQAGNVGNFDGIQIYSYSSAGIRGGGTAGVYSGPWRFSKTVINNPNTTTYTNAAAAAGSTTLSVASTSGMSVGMGIGGYGIAVSTTITSLTATTVTLSAATTAAIASGGALRYGWLIVGTAIHLLGNCFDWYFDHPEIAGGTALVNIEGTSGLPLPNTVRFDHMNATASVYYGLLITRLVGLRCTGGWWGDVPGGSTVYISAAGSDATKVSDIEFDGSLIGAAGLNGITAVCCTNLSIAGGEVVGNSLVSAGAYNGLYCGPAVRGTLSITGGTKLTNQRTFDAVGQAAYGFYLDTGCFGGTGDKVLIDGIACGGTVGPYADGSMPTGTAKVLTNIVY